MLTEVVPYRVAVPFVAYTSQAVAPVLDTQVEVGNEAAKALPALPNSATINRSIIDNLVVLRSIVFMIISLALMDNTSQLLAA